MLTEDEHFARLNAYSETPEWAAGRYDFDALVGQRWEITEDVYWYFLEVLPPVAFNGASFYMSERLSGEITSKYSQEGGRYYHEYAHFPKQRGR